MRKLIVISLLIGLLQALGTASFTIRTVKETYLAQTGSAITPGLCLGINPPPVYDEIIEQAVGVPFVLKTSSVQKIDNCTENTDFQIKKTPAVKNYLTSWQFYANWAIWTMPALGIGYVLRSRSKRLHPKTTGTISP